MSILGQLLRDGVELQKQMWTVTEGSETWQVMKDMLTEIETEIRRE